MPNQHEENPHDPWKPREPIDPDIPEYAEDVVNLEEENPPSEEATNEFFSSQKHVERLMEDFSAQQRAAALGKAAEVRAKEIYAQQKEEERLRSQHRRWLSGEEFDPNARSWKEMNDDD